MNCLKCGCLLQGSRCSKCGFSIDENNIVVIRDDEGNNLKAIKGFVEELNQLDEFRSCRKQSLNEVSAVLNEVYKERIDDKLLNNDRVISDHERTLKEAHRIQRLISKIGLPPFDQRQKNRMIAARLAYDALPKEYKSDVKNRKLLIDAEKKLKELQFQEELIQKKKIQEKLIEERIQTQMKQEKLYHEQADRVDNLILAIGDVRLNIETVEKIQLARKAYEELNDNERKYISKYTLLEEAEAKYQELYKKEKAAILLDQEKAQEVSRLISEIGLVRCDYESSMRIEFAREAYDALTTKQKACVKTYQALVDAESKYKFLLSENEEKSKQTIESRRQSLKSKQVRKILLFAGIISIIIFAVKYLFNKNLIESPKESLENESGVVVEGGNKEANQGIGTSITIKDFENLGFKYTSNEKSIKAGVLFHLYTDTDLHIFMNDSLRWIMYILPSAADSQKLDNQIFHIANENPEDLVDVGHGIRMSQAGIQNMYQLAAMMIQHPDRPFDSCLPEELQSEIRNNDLRVTLMGGSSHGKVSESGRWDVSSREYWECIISSPHYHLYRSIDKKGEGVKQVSLSFITGDDAGAALIKDAESVIGPEGLSENPEFMELYRQLAEALDKKGNSFNPETFKITLTPEATEALKAVLPYLNMP